MKEYKGQYEINLLDGSKIIRGVFGKEKEDPVFLNMQFFIERENYKRIIEECKMDGFAGIHEYIESKILGEECEDEDFDPFEGL